MAEKKGATEKSSAGKGSAKGSSGKKAAGKKAAGKKAAGKRAGGGGAEKTLAITQVRSRSGRPEQHRRTLEALGLRRHQRTVVQPDNPAIRGMIKQVEHLVEWREIGEES